MRKVIVLLVLISFPMTSIASQSQICKLKERSELSDMASCKKGDILRYYGFMGKSNLIIRTGCDFTQTIDHMKVVESSINDVFNLSCVYIGYQRKERK